MIEGHDKVVDYLPAGTREEVIMPSRRCPHCKVESSYQVGAERVRFSLQLPYLLRLDTCRNEECACVTGVVFDGSTGEIVETFPQLESEPDELFPEGVKIAFRQALRSLNEKIWDGCVLMCRRALEEAMVDLGAKGKVLYDKIEDLANQNKITPDLRDWAHEGRLAGKLGAHGTEEEEKRWNDETDAKEIIEFCKWFFRYIYILPKQLEQRRQRLTQEAASNGG